MDVQRLRLDTRIATSDVANLTAGVGRIIAANRIAVPPGRNYSFFRVTAGLDLGYWRARVFVIDGDHDPSTLTKIQWFTYQPDAGPFPSSIGVGLVDEHLTPPELNLPAPDQSATVVLPPGANSTVILAAGAPVASVRLYGLSGITTANASELDLVDAFGTFIYTAPGYFGLGPHNLGGYYVPANRLPLSVTTLAGYPGGRLTLNYSAADIPPAQYLNVDTPARFQAVPGDKLTALLVGAPQQSGLQYLPGGYLTLHGLDTDLALTRWS